MPKFKLQPAPTFRAPVEIPVPGEGRSKVLFDFKYRDRDAMKEFLEKVGNTETQLSDTDLIMEMCTGWELTDPFNRESVDLLVRNYIQAGSAIFEKYLDEHTSSKAREKN